jgi:hypothetical protein
VPVLQSLPTKERQAVIEENGIGKHYERFLTEWYYSVVFTDLYTTIT